MKSNEKVTPNRAKRSDAIDFRKGLSSICKQNLLYAFGLHILTAQSTDAVILATKENRKQSGTLFWSTNSLLLFLLLLLSFPFSF